MARQRLALPNLNLVIGVAACLAAAVFVVLAWPGSSATSFATPTDPPCTWARAADPAAAQPHGWSGMDGTGPNDIWAVGNNNSSVATMHFDGSAWSVVSAPGMPGQTSSHLEKVAAIAANDVWAIGTWYVQSNQIKDLIEHWDGSAWSIVDLPNDESHIYGIGGAAADDVWLVGEISGDGGDGIHSYLAHWDGSIWTRFPFQDLGLGGELQDVKMLAIDDGWAVGRGYESNATIEEVPRMLHWDGTSWTNVDAPHVSTSNTAIAVGGGRPEDLWAVGQRYDLYTGFPFYSLAEHWDGSAWTHFVMDDPGVWNVLADVSGVPGGDTWAVGDYFESADVNPQFHSALIFRWDGISWSREKTPLVPGFQRDALSAVYAATKNDVWAIGQHINPGNTSGPVLEHCSTDPDGDGIVNSADNCPTWYNPTQTLPDWPVPSGEADCDGFPDDIAASGKAAETKIGTDSLAPCASTTAPNDEADAMPPDFNDDQLINGQDSGKFGGPSGAYNHLVSQGPFNGLSGERFDFNGNGIINGQDTGKFQFYFNKSCA